MTPSQCSAARGALRLTLQQLAQAAEVGVNSITRFEKGQAVDRHVIERMKAALTKSGITFLEDDGAGAGIRWHAG